MNTPAPTPAQNPANIAAKQLIQLLKVLPISGIREDAFTEIIATQYHPLLEQAIYHITEFADHFEHTEKREADAIEFCTYEDRSYHHGLRDAAKERKDEALSLIAALNHALGEKSS